MKWEDALGHYGTQTAIANALGVHRQTLTRWDDEIPLPYQAQLQLLTDGKLIAELPEQQPIKARKRKRRAA